MMIVVPPAKGEKSWPSLGGPICDWIEEYLTFGPGDLLGQPAVLDDEKRALIHRAYQVYPRRHRMKGRRRFKRVAFSLRKGSAKTEFAAWIAACELHPQSPVRTVDWDSKGHPIGGGITDPYIPMVAYTEEQTEDLAYAALRAILEHSDLARDFDIGLERIMRAGGYGKAVALAAAPSARDGARTTFQHFDETHTMILPRLKKAHRAMLANIPKRRLADAWSLETTTAPVPGERSVAEETMEYAEAISNGTVKDATLFFFHRQASDKHDITKKRGLRAAIVEASGPLAKWSDIPAIMDQWKDPNADPAELERLWLNRPTRASSRAFDVASFKKLAEPKRDIEDGAMVTLGFDGARYHDSTALVATEIESGHQVLLGIWERPHAAKKWEVPEDEVEQVIAAAFERWSVWRMYADPPYWETNVASWAGEHGEKCVVAWPTNRWRKMADAVRAYVNAIAAGELSHDGHLALVRHIGNAFRRNLPRIVDDKGQPMWIIQKERPDSPFKIDVAMAAILSWEARRDALTLGVGRPEEEWDGNVIVLQ